MAEPPHLVDVSQPVAIWADGMKTEPQGYQFLPVARTGSNNHFVPVFSQGEGDGDVRMQVA